MFTVLDKGVLRILNNVLLNLFVYNNSDANDNDFGDGNDNDFDDDNDNDFDDDFDDDNDNDFDDDI